MFGRPNRSMLEAKLFGIQNAALGQTLGVRHGRLSADALHLGDQPLALTAILCLFKTLT